MVRSPRRPASVARRDRAIDSRSASQTSPYRARDRPKAAEKRLRVGWDRTAHRALRLDDIDAGSALSAIDRPPGGNPRPAPR